MCISEERAHLAAADDALGLLLHRQRANEGGHLLSRLPLGQLRQALLARPHAGVFDLEELLAGAGVEDEIGAVVGLGGLRGGGGGRQVWQVRQVLGQDGEGRCRDAAAAAGNSPGQPAPLAQQSPSLTRLPSNVLWIVTRYTLVSSTNLPGWGAQAGTTAVSRQPPRLHRGLAYACDACCSHLHRSAPDDLVGEELAVVLAGQVRLRGLGAAQIWRQQVALSGTEGKHGRPQRWQAFPQQAVWQGPVSCASTPVQLQRLAHALAQHVERGVALHDLGQRLGGGRRGVGQQGHINRGTCRRIQCAEAKGQA